MQENLQLGVITKKGKKRTVGEQCNNVYQGKCIAKNIFKCCLTMNPHTYPIKPQWTTAPATPMTAERQQGRFEKRTHRRIGIEPVRTEPWHVSSAGTFRQLGFLAPWIRAPACGECMEFSGNVLLQFIPPLLPLCLILETLTSDPLLIRWSSNPVTNVWTFDSLGQLQSPRTHP